MKLTPATLALRDALARVLAECWHEENVGDRWPDGEFREIWLHRADTALAAGAGRMSAAVDKVRREAFEAGASPALSVLLTELEEAGPGEYQDGLARAVLLLSQEMGMHYGAVFEAGVRTGRTQRG